MHIFSQMDGGNVAYLGTADDDVQLAIRQDSHSSFYQWFYFAALDPDARARTLVLTNAAAAAYPDGWQDYQALASDDQQHWYRVPTQYQEGQLRIEHAPSQGWRWYAYFVPYGYDRYLQTLARWQQTPALRCQSLGATVAGRSIDLLRLGTQGQPKIWLSARQHPGETMASWFVEALVDALLHTPAGQTLCQQAEFFVLPHLNPDGAVLGNLRTNALGINLNREWSAPSEARSPEVFYARQAMQQRGVDLYLDLHGDESLPWNFLAGQLGSDQVSAEVLAQEQAFKDDYSQASVDFQQQHGYAPGQFGEQSLTMASFWVGHAFQCPAMTLEMPFKEHWRQQGVAMPCEPGWSVSRTQALAQALLTPLLLWCQRRN